MQVALPVAGIATFVQTAVRDHLIIGTLSASGAGEALYASIERKSQITSRAYFMR
jgi:hypothetical protein